MKIHLPIGGLKPDCLTRPYQYGILIRVRTWLWNWLFLERLEKSDDLTSERVAYQDGVIRLSLDLVQLP